MIYSISFWFLLFLIYSIVGWLVEMVSCSILEKKWVINRGFLIGPYCPIYGVAALLMIFLLNRYINDPIALFIMSTVICSVIEYMTSYVMQKIFKARWWDYSKKKFNLNGRICLTYSVFFGLLGLLVMYILNPFFSNLLTKIPKIILIVIATVLMIIFLTDLIVSLIVISIVRKNTILIDKQDNTEEIRKQVTNHLIKHQLLIKRLLNAFPDVKKLFKKHPLEEWQQLIKHIKKQNH